MHKLDYALDHLLIDEAQDTSPEQWAIVTALTAELFSGASARRGIRTVFAVGDEKQSIFSFQGAAPQEFAEMRRFFERRHREAELAFRPVELHFSFRSAQVDSRRGGLRLCFARRLGRRRCAGRAAAEPSGGARRA